MFCNQCEQTKHGVGCTVMGVCGKNSQVAALQDLLIYVMQGVAFYAHEGRQQGLVDGDADEFTLQALYATLTNVEFDPARMDALIRQAVEIRDALRSTLNGEGVDPSQGPTGFVPESTLHALSVQGLELNLLEQLDSDPDVRSLKQTVLFGLKGIAAYAYQAWLLGKRDDAITGFCHEALAALLRCDWTLEQWTEMALRVGEINLNTMELLDAAHTGTFGHPQPTQVSLGVRAGKAILVTGHDLQDLSRLLEQTRDTGIQIYTHGEMLPAHGYPALNAHPHLAGHFGTAWQNQQVELPQFPGPVLFTTNCIQRPEESYRARVFTTGLVGWPGCRHLVEKDFSSLIQAAESMEGFAEDRETGSVMVGFGHHTVLGLADRIVEGVQSQAIRHFFLVGGCDGARPGRDYFTRFVEQVPEDCVVLTLACGKFRFFDQKLGQIGDIPRLLDVGQCNDAYSAVRIAQGLADAFTCSVNDLPLSLILSWYEQKAVAILLSLLHLGFRDIRLGPSLPAFMTPPVLDVLVQQFQLRPIAESPQEDLDAILCPAC